MQFEHRIQALGANLLVTHEVRFSGWLSGFLMRIVGSGLIRSLPNAMQGLKATCEEGKLGSDSN